MYTNFLLIHKKDFIFLVFFLIPIEPKQKTLLEFTGLIFMIKFDFIYCILSWKLC